MIGFPHTRWGEPPNHQTDVSNWFAFASHTVSTNMWIVLAAILIHWMGAAGAHL